MNLTHGRITTLHVGCLSPFQDAEYGKGVRICTPVNGKSGAARGTGNSVIRARCTVCGREEHQVSESKIAKAK